MEVSKKDINPSIESSIFYDLGAWAATFKKYYDAVGNKVVAKNLPTFMAWMEDRTRSRAAALDIFEFLERRYAILFPPNKIRAFKDERSQLARDTKDSKDIKEAREDFLAGDPLRVVVLKDCFVASSYWRKKVKNMLESAEDSLIDPVVAFFNGFDKDADAYAIYPFIHGDASNQERAAFAVGRYFGQAMIAEILLLGNRSLERRFLSMFKQMDNDALVSIFEATAATSINISQRIKLDPEKKDMTVLSQAIANLQSMRKTSALELIRAASNGTFKDNVSREVIHL
ncbi:MAG: hypothetical protein Q6365_021130, partial [Candidatus Sigynarchaeota archaeon]